MHQKTAVADNAGHLLISQVQISGDKAGYDFIEIFNPTSGAINLKNYKLVKRSAKADAAEYSIKSWRNEGDVFMPSGSYFLWASEEYFNYASSYMNIDAVTSVGISGNNGIALKTNDTNKIIDSVAWGETQNIFIEGGIFPSNPEPNQSLERKNKESYPNALDTDNNANDFILVVSRPRNSRSSYAAVEGDIPIAVTTVTPSLMAPPIVTPTENDNVAQAGSNKGEEIIVTPTMFPSVTTYPQNVRINEFLPDPEGRDDEGEWIEVFNNSNQDVNLSGWQLDDEVGKGSNSYKITETSIKAFGYVVFPYKQTKITLNNDIGEINFIAPNRQLMQKVAYVKALIGESYNYFNNGWRWCKKTTPLGENDKCESSGKAVDNSNNNDNSGNLAVGKETGNFKENGVSNDIANNSKKIVTISPQTKKSSEKNAGSSIIPQKKKSKTSVGVINNAAIDNESEKEENFSPEADNYNTAGKNLKNSAIASPLRIMEKSEKKPSLIPYVFLVSGLGMVFALGSLRAKEFFLRKNKNLSALDK